MSAYKLIFIKMAKEVKDDSRAAQINGLRETEGPIELSVSCFSKKRKEYERAREAFERALEDLHVPFHVLHFRLAIFGSARIEKETKPYKFVVSLAEELVKQLRADIKSGGGPGVMEAANEGFHKGREALPQEEWQGLASHAVRIHLPFEDGITGDYQKKKVHRNFSTRLQHFANGTHGAYTAEGGFGSGLEFMYLLQLLQVGHLEDNYPIILHSYWKPILDALYNRLYHERDHDDKDRIPLISPEDVEIVKISDNIDEIVEIFREFAYNPWKELNDRVVLVD